MSKEKSRKRLFAESLGFVVVVLMGVFIGLTILAGFFISPVPSRAMTVGGLAAAVVTLFVIIPLALLEANRRAQYAEKDCQRLDQCLSAARNQLQEARNFIAELVRRQDVCTNMKTLQAQYCERVAYAQTFLRAIRVNAEPDSVSHLDKVLRAVASARDDVARVEGRLRKAYDLAIAHNFTPDYPLEEYLKPPQASDEQSGQ